MATFTSSLPDQLLQQLSEAAENLSMPKNKIIEKALTIYLNQIKRREYINSYKEMNSDQDLLNIAAEDMAEYLAQLDKEI